MNRSLVCMLMMVTMTSCEGFREAVGIVKDKTTMAPLDSVRVFVKTASRSEYTDSTGKFHVQNRMSGCIGGCPDIVVEFSKPGYHSVQLKNPDSTEVLLERQ